MDAPPYELARKKNQVVLLPQASFGGIGLSNRLTGNRRQHRAVSRLSARRGTYIRSLAHEHGAEAGLRCPPCGNSRARPWASFRWKQAIPLEELGGGRTRRKIREQADSAGRAVAEFSGVTHVLPGARKTACVTVGKFQRAGVTASAGPVPSFRPERRRNSIANGPSAPRLRVAEPGETKLIAHRGSRCAADVTSQSWVFDPLALAGHFGLGPLIPVRISSTSACTRKFPKPEIRSWPINRQKHLLLFSIDCRRRIQLRRS